MVLLEEMDIGSWVGGSAAWHGGDARGWCGGRLECAFDGIFVSSRVVLFVMEHLFIDLLCDVESAASKEVACGEAPSNKTHRTLIVFAANIHVHNSPSLTSISAPERLPPSPANAPK